MRELRASAGAVWSASVAGEVEIGQVRVPQDLSGLGDLLGEGLRRRAVGLAVGVQDGLGLPPQAARVTPADPSALALGGELGGHGPGSRTCSPVGPAADRLPGSGALP